MKKQSKVKTVLKAKFSNNTPIEDWHLERLDKCNACPFNTKNKEELDTSDLAMISLNLGKDTCSLCGCAVEDKTAVKGEACAKENTPSIGAPEWNRIEIKTSSSDKIDILNSDSEYNIDLISGNVNVFLGDIEKSTDYKFSLTLSPKKDYKVKDVKVEAGCSCTTTDILEEEGGTKISINYKSGKSIGKVVKNSTVKYKVGTKEFLFKVIVRGTIK